MPDPTTYIAFLGALLAYQLSGPGPDMILVASRGIALGPKMAFVTAVGCVSAGVVQIPLLALGLASLINASPLAHEILRWIGAIYLIYVGAKFLLSARHLESSREADIDAPSLWSAFSQGMISNLTNPQTLAFMLALLPQFVTANGTSPVLQLVILGLTMKGVGLIVLGSVALASGSAGSWLSGRPRALAWQRGFAGVAMIGLALYMLFAHGAMRRT
jgi:threonine/homoserine/homoserine lactone efflux protein